jgi:hypothetical protein
MNCGGQRGVAGDPVINKQEVDWSYESDAGIHATFGVSGGNVILRVYGLLANTFYWACTVRQMFVLTSS